MSDEYICTSCYNKFDVTQRDNCGNCGESVWYKLTENVSTLCHHMKPIFITIEDVLSVISNPQDYDNQWRDFLDS